MTPLPQELSPAELAQRLARGEPVCLLDVREAEEVALAALPGAVHIPLRSLPARVGELDPRATIVVYCHHGMRSAMAAEWLVERGFQSVLNLAGGIDAWAREVDPTMPRYT
ncbi:MAG: rhodanese-like domain-containing protein [Candidatus Binatia bacterium]|nr:rhodanese-like domain-containing protein [Candidatus Binatia bacterium]